MAGRRVLGFAAAVAIAVVAIAVVSLLHGPDSERSSPSIANSASDGKSRSPEVDPSKANNGASDVAGADVQARREGFTAREPSSPDASEHAPAAAILKIVATNRVGGGRLAGVVVTPEASDFAPRELAALRTRNALAPDAKLEFTTDADGAATLHWIPGRALFVAFRPGGREVDEQTQNVPPLRVDEVRELAVELFGGPDLPFFGALVAAGAEGEAARPVAGAQVLFHDWRVKSTPVATSGTDGRFDFTARSWRNGCVEIVAEGFAPAFARVEPGHETVERALVLKLAKPAQLRARVRDASGVALQGAAIKLSTAPMLLVQPKPLPVDAPRIERTATTDDAGRATLDALPPGVSLDLEVRAAGWAPIHQEGALRFAAGETAEREFTLGTVARVRGRVVAANGDAIEAARVRMTPQIDPASKVEQPISWHQIRRAAKATGADGRFEIADVPSGKWWLDLDPGVNGFVGNEQVGKDSTVLVRGEKHVAAAPALAVDVPAHTKELDVELVVTLDLSIRGRVRVPDGGTVYGIRLLARPLGTTWLDPVQAAPKTDGTFVLEPLVDGEWEVMVDVEDASQGYGDPPTQRVKAGATDVEFVLERSAATIAGRVIDATTAAPVDDAWCSVTDAVEGGERARGSRDGGRFEIQVPKGGTYTIRVTTRDGRFGLATNVVVTPGGRSDPLEIAVAAGAKLKLKAPDPPTNCRFEVRRDGVVVASDEFGGLKEIERTVPSGHLEVRVFRGDEPLSTHDVDAKSGTTVSVGE